MDYEAKKSVRNSWEKANPISLLFFAWIYPLFRKGYGKDLTIHDLPETPKVQKSNESANVLSKAWEDQKLESKKSATPPRIWKALLGINKRQFLMHLGILGINGLIVRVMQPIYLRLLIKTFEEGSTATDQDQFTYAAVVCLCSLFNDLALPQCDYLMLRTGLSCRTACSSLIFRKVMKLSPQARAQVTVGYLMNLLSTDVGRFDFGLLYISYIIIGPLQMVILFYILFDEMGVAALAGIPAILFIMLTQVINGKLSVKFRGKVAKQTDKRSRIMNEIVMAMRVIKMYAWERPFSTLVGIFRKNEVKELTKRAYLQGFFISLYSFGNHLISFFIIITFVLLGNEITADKAFFTYTISWTMSDSMAYYFSTAVSSLGEIFASTSRIDKFLLLEEQKVTMIKSSDTKSTNDIGSGSIKLENVAASWSNTEKVTLKDINLTMEGDKVVMIVGPSGSGKTSLLHLLISELPVLSGNIKSQGQISYASQESWIFPGNIRENILFGEPFDKAHYNDVIQACALEEDFQQLPNGDLSTGTLSGGQKARVNLARSLYRKGNIFIMDDPLSAVDSRVSRHIFEKCIKGHLNGKLRILVTHQLQYLNQADYIIFLKNGSIHDQGTYEALASKGLFRGSPRKMSTARIEVEAEELLKEFEKPENHAEKVLEGSVSMRTYWNYIKLGKSSPRLIFVVILFVCSQLLFTGSEYWLSYWTDSEESKKSNNVDSKNKIGFKLNSTASSTEDSHIYDPDDYLGQKAYMGIYTGIVGALIIINVTRTVTFFNYCLRISTNLHNSMFKSIVRAPIKFYDHNPSGRITNRFTKDLGTIDELLPTVLFDAMFYLLQMITSIVVITSSNYYLAVPTIILLIVFWGLRIGYIQTSRDVKRLESTWKSPVFTHVAASMQGLTTIRSFEAQDKLIAQFDDKQDIHSAAWFTVISTTTCLIATAEAIGIIFLIVVVFSFLFFETGTSGGIVSLVISSTLDLTTNIQWAIRLSADTENYMTVVERALEYTKLSPEASLESTDTKKPPPNWPHKGQLQFENVCLSYENSDVLKNLNFCIKSNEKIGIVGRTGAGKSSIIAALFRLTESRGNIFIDGIRIKDIGLHELRQSISIIPQDPILFFGTLRYNLDPFDQFSDDELWAVLEEVQLKEAAPALDFKVSISGSNFSVGQRQCIALARAILRKNRIVILDEATTNVDHITSEFIHKTIKSKFAKSSVITIAHRLDSVMDCDRVLVLDNGMCLEYDHPHILLQNRESRLSDLAGHTGGADDLRKIAKKHYKKNVEIASLE